jgi:hypothetical protein
VAEASAALVPAGTFLPAWCDRHLAAPGSGDFFDSRTWFDCALANTMPPGARALLARHESVLLVLARAAGRTAALTTPYTLAWRPLPAPDATAESLRQAGRAIARAMGLAPPLRLDALDAEAPALAPLLEGFQAAGRVVLRYAHFGNWHEALAPGQGWEAYLAARPATLRTTLGRKVNRARKTLRFELLTAPGPALEAGISAYETVRAASWKPYEPFPDFDRALMRAAAAERTLRLGVLRLLTNGQPIAAQYWVVRGGRAAVLKLAHDQTAREASPGTVLTGMMIDSLIAEGGVRELDFGRGDDDYKQLWVGTRRQRIGVLLVDPRHPAGLASLARHAAGRLRARLRGAGRSAA